MRKLKVNKIFLSRPSTKLVWGVMWEKVGGDAIDVANISQTASLKLAFLFYLIMEYYVFKSSH